MLITVAICTRNRSQSLYKTLQSLVLAKKPTAEWECLVVDNGSKDGTRDTIQSFRETLPIRYVLEERAGLSNARNTAVVEALGEYICWTDDDVLIDEYWLTSYENGFRKWPRAAIFGGKVIPMIVEPAPLWFVQTQKMFSPALAARDLGEDEIPLEMEADILPWGANFAIRTREQRLAVYDPELGVAPGRARVGEEITLVKALMRGGASGMWLPDNKVRHVIDHDRQTIKYLQRYYMAQGATSAYLGQVPSGKKLFGVPIWLWISALTKYMRFRIAHLTKSPDDWVPKLRAAAFEMGKVVELKSW